MEKFAEFEDGNKRSRYNSINNGIVIFIEFEFNNKHIRFNHIDNKEIITVEFEDDGNQNENDYTCYDFKKTDIPRLIEFLNEQIE